MIAVSSFEAQVVAWTIRGALACMVVFFGFRFSKLPLKDSALELAKGVWLIGSLLSLLHAISTMAFHHQFEHQLAYDNIAYQTQQAIGIAIGFGIWLNYLFVIVWLFDALWLNGFPSSYAARKRTINWVVYGFLGFIAINGAIVFESGPVRWLGILAIVVLLFIWKSNAQNNSHEEPDV